MVSAWIQGRLPVLKVMLAMWAAALIEWVESSIPELLMALDGWKGEIDQWITDQLASFESAAMNIGSSIIDGIVAGINAGAQEVQDAIFGVGGDLIGSFADAVGVKSPSTVFMALGGDVIEGLRLGLTDNQAVMDTMMGLAHGMQQPVLAGVGAGGGATSINNGSSVGPIHIQVLMPEAALNLPAGDVRAAGNAFGEGIMDRLQFEIRKNL
jgi:hypothetical protein